MDRNVNTLNGPIKGAIYETVFGKEILAFYCIPYLKTPIGNLRFKDPQPVDNWNEVLDCTLPGIPSLIKMPDCDEIVGDETAIYINAYTATIKPNELRPVMIFIHGGAFVYGSSCIDFYAPDYLLEKNIVLFTFNYRLGVFGFLNFDDPKLGVPGNAGLKDQTMAIRWIKNNCENFGGDPNNITLFGQSAGGASVHYHTVCELSQGLFHKAIELSGSMSAPWASMPNQNFGFRLARSFGWKDGEPTENALEILQNVPGESLLLAIATTFLTPKERSSRLNPFIPCVEPYVSEQCFIPKPINELLINPPWGKDLPLIISITSNESLIFANKGFTLPNQQTYDQFGDFQDLLPRNLRTRRKEFGLRLKKFYYGDDQPSVKNHLIYLNLLSDISFVYPAYVSIQSRISNAIPTAPTYLLRFAFESPSFNHKKMLMLNKLHVTEEKGACHGDDLCYIFKNQFYEMSGGLKTGTKEYKTMERMVSLFTNFAATSDPNGPETELNKWEPIVDQNLPYKCLNVADDLEFIEFPETDRVKFWAELYDQQC